MTITDDEIRKAALELIEKAAKPQCVIAGNTIEERVKAAKMVTLNERRMQVTLGYINGVCAVIRKLTEGEKNDN